MSNTPISKEEFLAWGKSNLIEITEDRMVGNQHWFRAVFIETDLMYRRVFSDMPPGYWTELVEDLERTKNEHTFNALKNEKIY